MYVHQYDRNTKQVVVGYYFGTMWVPMSSFKEYNHAARFINYLNGGDGANVNIIEDVGDE